MSRVFVRLGVAVCAWTMAACTTSPPPIPPISAPVRLAEGSSGSAAWTADVLAKGEDQRCVLVKLRHRGTTVEDSCWKQVDGIVGWSTRAPDSISPTWLTFGWTNGFVPKSILIRFEDGSTSAAKVRVLAGLPSEAFFVQVFPRGKNIAQLQILRDGRSPILMKKPRSDLLSEVGWTVQMILPTGDTQQP